MKFNFEPFEFWVTLRETSINIELTFKFVYLEPGGEVWTGDILLCSLSLQVVNDIMNTGDIAYRDVKE